MKKILLILLLFSTITNAQYRRVLAAQTLEISESQNNDISNFEIGFQEILNEAISVGAILPTVTDQRLLNDIYIIADAEGLLDGDFFYHYKNSGDLTFQRVNWSNASGIKATEEGTGSGLLPSSTGLTGDGDNYIDSQIIPTYTKDNASIIIDVVTVGGNDKLFEADYNGLQSVIINANNAFKYFNSDATNRETADMSGAGFYSISRNALAGVDFAKNGVVFLNGTHTSVNAPNDSYHLFRINTGAMGTSKIGCFISTNAINGNELDVYNALNNAPAVTLTGGIQSDGYTPLVLSGSYGTSTAGVFTFDKVAAEITEGNVSKTVARNNRDILSEAIRYAVEVENDSVFLFGDLDCYVDTGANQFRELTREASIQSNYDGLRISGNYDTTVLRMYPHSFIAGAIFNIYKASDMELSKMTLLGEKMLHDYSTPYTNAPHEFPAGIVLEGAPNMVIDSVISNDFTGDGLTVYHSASRNDNGTIKAGELATTNLIVKNCEFRRNRRNNISYVDCDGFILENSILDFAGEGGDYDYGSTWDWRGVLPRCNIDFEATRNRGEACELLLGQIVRAGIIRNNTFTRAWIDDLNFYTCSDIEVHDNTFTRSLAVPVVANDLNIHHNTLTYDDTMSNYSFGIYLKSYTNACIPVSENGQHTVNNNTITGYDYGIHITDLGSNVYDNIIIDSPLAGILVGGIDGTITNNTITNTDANAKGYDTPSAGSTPENVIVSGGTVTSPLYSIRVRSANATGAAGLTFDNVNCINDVRIQNSDSITIKNSTYPAITQSNNTNIVLTNNNN